MNATAKAAAVERVEALIVDACRLIDGVGALSRIDPELEPECLRALERTEETLVALLTARSSLDRRRDARNAQPD